MPELARDIVVEKGLDLYNDQVLVRHFGKEIQKLFPQTEVRYYPDTFMVIAGYDGLIAYKFLLDEYNSSMPLSFHVQACAKNIHALKSGIIPVRDMSSMRKNMSKFNKKSGKSV